MIIVCAVLLILASQRIESIINLSGDDESNQKMTREVRGAPPTSIEWMIIAYVAGEHFATNSVHCRCPELKI